jgi:hypothetical protein
MSDLAFNLKVKMSLNVLGAGWELWFMPVIAITQKNHSSMQTGQKVSKTLSQKTTLAWWSMPIISAT